MGLTDILINNIIENLGIKKENIDKLQTIIDNIEVKSEDGQTTIEINLKKIKIVIER
jgi:hypothetical protein